MFLYAFVFVLIAISSAASSAVRNLASISTCRASEFTCLDGTCISAGVVCDTNWDCPDGSDEASCYSSTNSNLTEATVSHERYKRQSPCGINQWRCTDGACIAVGGKCDGKMDCPDRSDEAGALCGIILSTQSAKCVLPPYPEHGTYVVTNHPSASPGQSFQFAQLNITCEQGYGVVGDTVPYCLDGTWYKPIQNCVPFCRLDPDVSVYYYCQIPETEGYRLCNQSEPSGTLVKPVCNAPVYGLTTDLLLSMTCRSDGKWNRITKCKPECGRVTPYSEGLIRGGTEAVRGELPWHVAIYEKPTQRRNYYKQFCGGSLVSNRIVITAAHCFGDKGVTEKPASNYAVATAKLFREWDHKDDKDAQKSELKSIERPPHYLGARSNYQHDIAVLILETPFVYYIYVRPVCLDLLDPKFNDRQLQKGNLGKVAGWGLTDQNGPASPILKTVELPFVPIDECIRITPPSFTESITGDKICAGYNNGTAAVCKGDSGGGLSFPEHEGNTTRYYLRGVVSTAPRVSEACNVFSVTAFTEIYQHKDFIKQFTSTKCTLPPYPEYGVYEIAGDPAAKPGDDSEKVYLNVSCNHGYSVIGNNVVQCNLGEWSARMPECVRFCRLDPDVSVHYNCKIPGTNVYRICNQSEPSGTLVKPECNAPNYSSRDLLPFMTCQSDGKWNRIIKCRPECGRVTPDVEGLVLGGTEAIRGKLPWHVIIYRKFTERYYTQICGGSLVSNRIAISAAQCFWDHSKNEKLAASNHAVATAKLFREWDHIDDKDAQKSELTPIELSPYYQGARTNFQHDIAVLILETPFVYDMYVRPVCLDFEIDFNRRQLQKGNFGKVASWALAEENGPASPVLKVVVLPFVPIDECIRITPPSFTESITGDKICAGSNNAKEGCTQLFTSHSQVLFQGTATVCRGVSGGGLSFPEIERGTTRYYLRGIVSIAPLNDTQVCATVTTATEIYQHKDFISQMMYS